MANKKITDLNELTSLSNDDWFEVVDSSDTTDSPLGTSKKVKGSFVKGLTAPQEIQPNFNPSYLYWSAPTSGSETSLGEIVTFLNNKTFTINSSKLVVIKVLCQKTINGVFNFIEKKYLFNKNNINGTWGIGTTNGNITASDLIFVNESVPTPNNSTNDIVIELGNIGTDDIVTYLNNNPQPTSGQNWELQADTNYWFSYKSNGSDIVDFYRGNKPVILGNQPSGNYDVVISDFQRISTDGVDESVYITINDVEDYVDSLPKHHEFACSDEESDLEVMTVYNQRLLRAFNNVTRIDFGVQTAPTGSMIVLDVLKNGVSIFTTKPRIDIGAFTTLVPPSGMPDQAIIGGSVNFAQGDLLTVKIDQVGSTTAGTNLKAQMTYK